MGLGGDDIRGDVLSFSELLRASSVVVSPNTPILRPAMACRLCGPSMRIRSEAPSTKVASEKSTISRRERVAVVASQSRSALPCWIASKRSVTVTGT